MSNRQQRGAAPVVSQDNPNWAGASSERGRQDRTRTKGKGKLVRIPTPSPSQSPQGNVSGRHATSQSRRSSTSSRSYNSSISERSFDGPQRANTPAPEPSQDPKKRVVSWSTPHLLISRGVGAALARKHHNRAAQWFASENRASYVAGKQLTVPLFWKKREPDGSLKVARIFFNDPPKFALAKFKHHHHGVPSHHSYEIVGTDGIGVIKLLGNAGKLVPSALDDQWVTLLHQAFNHRAFDELDRDCDPKFANFYMLFCSGSLHSFYKATEAGKMQCERQMKRLIGKESPTYGFPGEWARPLEVALSKAHERQVV